MAGMKKSGLAALAMATVLSVTGTALAANPQIKSATASVVITNTANKGALSVAVQVVGLGSGQQVGFSLNASADVTWGCINKSLKAPKAENKRFVPGSVSASGSLPPADKNGSIKASIISNAPDAPTATDLKCPSSMSVALVSVAYSSIVLTITGAGLDSTRDLPPASYVFYQ